jgi:acyl carrier protein
MSFDRTKEVVFFLKSSIMSQSDIYNKIRWILVANFRVNEPNNHYTANFYNDLGLDSKDLDLFLFYVENKFHVQFPENVTNEVKNLKQVVSLVHKQMFSQKSSANQLKVA